MEVKYYMNNPCEVLRVISDEFVELKVYPKFVDNEFNGSGWCTECTAGSGYSRHTCGEYQDVIDYIVDYGQSMIIIAESRLVHEKPIEFKQWSSIRNDIKSKYEYLSALNSEIDKLKSDSRWLSQYVADLKEELFGEKINLDNISDMVIEKSGELSKIERYISSSSVDINAGIASLSIDVNELRKLIEAQITLDYLMSGGVDGWEWYSESMPDDIDSLVRERVRSMKAFVSI